MRIVLASSEAVPYSKTGGLADVSGALAKALAAAGHTVTLVVPHYPQLQRKAGRSPLDVAGPEVVVRVGDRDVTAQLHWAALPASEVTVLFVDCPAFFDRPALYNDANGDYGDNAARFCFFSRVVLEACRTLVLRPDVIHANDWQTGTIPALLASEYRGRPGFERTASVFTIHNLAYQGSFPWWDFGLTGLDWKFFNPAQAEHWGGMNLLKLGIATADQVTTVSPTYAWEITTPLGGMGLEGVLGTRRDDLVGILNGIDPDEWNAATDPHLPTNYDVETVFERKPECKRYLQQESSLPTRTDVPLFGMVSRMADQKGFDLIATAAEELAAFDAQFVFLGSGDPRYESLVRHLANSHREKFAATVGFDDGLAHRIEAGADAFLMPSRFEPCGLNQMYSLAYGTVPVVRTVGGLKDTVVDATPRHLFMGEATGFRFDDYDAASLVTAVRRATEMFGKKTLWHQLVRTGMSQDFTWAKSAGLYEDVYKRAKHKLAS